MRAFYDRQSSELSVQTTATIQAQQPPDRLPHFLQAMFPCVASKRGYAPINCHHLDDRRKGFLVACHDVSIRGVKARICVYCMTGRAVSSVYKNTAIGNSNPSIPLAFHVLKFKISFPEQNCYQDSTETGIASRSPAPQISGASSVSPEDKCYITNLVIECKPDDANNIAFNGMRITVFCLGREDGETLPLEKVGPAMWKHESAIELPAIINTFTIIAQSERGGDLGRVYLAGDELKMSTTSEASSDNHVRREFITEAGGPTLTLSFQTCIIPSDGSTVEQVAATTLDLELGFATIGMIPDDDPAKPDLLIACGRLFLERFRHSGSKGDIDNSILACENTIQLIPISDVRFVNVLGVAGKSFVKRYAVTGSISDADQATSMFEIIVDSTPEGHNDKPAQLNDLGNSLRSRFEHTGNLSDISRAIYALQKVVHLTPNGHSDIPSWLNNLGNSLRCRFERTGDLGDISEAISVYQKAVHLTPSGHSAMPSWLNNLGNSFTRRFKRTGDLTDMYTAISSYHLAATSFTGSPSVRLRYARKWAKLSQIHNPTQTLDAYSVAIRLVSQVAGLEQTIQRRHINLTEISDISTSAAAAAFYFGNYGLALQWLEQGRCLVWNQLNNLRTPLDDLRACDSTLADHFSAVSRALENSGSRTESGSLGIEASMASKMTLQAEAITHVKLAQEWDQLLVRIRNISDFQDFLQPPKTLHLKHLPTVGAVVVINVDETRCDALALLSGTDTPHHIPLPDFSHQQADTLRGHLHSYLTSHRVRSRGSELDTRALRLHRGSSSKGIQEILSDLWLLVVKPILDGLAILHPTTDPSRIWWCATGPLAFLPIHAAGIYGQSDKGLGHCLSDFAISSYTPTVSTLTERVRHPRKMDIASNKLLLISQPNTPGLSPIPGTTTETMAVMTIMGKDKVKASHLEKEAATIARVFQEMATHSSIHLACHAIQDIKNPLQSGFFLQDGRLELSEIIKRQTTNADLAFLSACQTSSGDEKLSEEAVHLAAGMLAAGYRGVVATMWSITDCYGPEIAEDFYENLLSSGILRGEEGLKSAGAAHALHYSTRRLRSKLDDSESALLAWVPYVHFGL